MLEEEVVVAKVAAEAVEEVVAVDKVTEEASKVDKLMEDKEVQARRHNTKLLSKKVKPHVRSWIEKEGAIHLKEEHANTTMVLIQSQDKIQEQPQD